MRRITWSRGTVGGSLAAILAVAMVAATALAASRARPPSIRLSAPLPQLVRVGDVVNVRGQVRRVPKGTLATLEMKRSTGPWSPLASAGLRRGGAFAIRWRVPDMSEGPVELRVAAIRRGRVLTATAAAHSWVGPAAVYCYPPAPPGNIPAGDGWITGGLYGEGGAYPGMHACADYQYTVTVTDSGGQLAATQTVPARHSYTLVVPAGSYTLTSGPCRGSATVSAGHQTQANTYCLYP